MCFADGFRAGFGETEVFYFAGLDEVFHGSGDVFDGNFEIDAMLVVEIDVVGLEALERFVADLLDVVGMAVQCAPLSAVVRIRLPAEFRGDHKFVAKRSEAFADEFFVDVRAVDFGGVEESDAAIDAGVEELDHFGFVFRRAKAKAHAHAAEADFGDFEAAFSEFAFLHCCSSLFVGFE